LKLKIPSNVVCLAALIAGMFLIVTQAPAQTASPAAAASPVVKLTLIVTNKAGLSVEDVRQEDIQVFEGKQPRPISTFSKDLRPVDYGLVMDNSQSFRTLLAPVVGAAKSLINNKRPEEEIFIIRFTGSDDIRTMSDFTSNKAELISGLDELYISNGQSAVIDAVGIAIDHMMKVKGADTLRRRALVLFTDGEDRASYNESDPLVKLIRENDVQVFVIGFVHLLDPEPGFTRPSARVKAEKLLKRIAEESGGRAFFPRGADELNEAMSQVAHDLHFQYLVGFTRESKPAEKGFRKIKIETTVAPGREKLKLIARPGYLVSGPSQPTRN